MADGEKGFRRGRAKAGEYSGYGPDPRLKLMAKMIDTERKEGKVAAGASKFGGLKKSSKTEAATAAAADSSVSAKQSTTAGKLPAAAKFEKAAAAEKVESPKKSENGAKKQLIPGVFKSAEPAKPEKPAEKKKSNGSKKEEKKEEVSSPETSESGPKKKFPFAIKKKKEVTKSEPEATAKQEEKPTEEKEVDPPIEEAENVEDESSLSHAQKLAKFKKMDHTNKFVPVPKTASASGAEVGKAPVSPPLPGTEAPPEETDVREDEASAATHKQKIARFQTQRSGSDNSSGSQKTPKVASPEAKVESPTPKAAPTKDIAAKAQDAVAPEDVRQDSQPAEATEAKKTAPSVTPVRPNFQEIPAAAPAQVKTGDSDDFTTPPESPAATAAAADISAVSAAPAAPAETPPTATPADATASVKWTETAVDDQPPPEDAACIQLPSLTTEVSGAPADLRVEAEDSQLSPEAALTPAADEIDITSDVTKESVQAATNQADIASPVTENQADVDHSTDDTVAQETEAEINKCQADLDLPIIKDPLQITTDTAKGNDADGEGAANLAESYVPSCPMVVFGDRAFPLRHCSETQTLIVEGLQIDEPEREAVLKHVVYENKEYPLIYNSTDNTIEVQGLHDRLQNAAPDSEVVASVKLVICNGEKFAMKHDSDSNTIKLVSHDVKVLEQTENKDVQPEMTNMPAVEEEQAPDGVAVPKDMDAPQTDVAPLAKISEKVMLDNGVEYFMKHDATDNAIKLVRKEGTSEPISVTSETAAASTATKVVVVDGVEVPLSYDLDSSTIRVGETTSSATEPEARNTDASDVRHDTTLDSVAIEEASTAGQATVSHRPSNKFVVYAGKSYPLIYDSVSQTVVVEGLAKADVEKASSTADTSDQEVSRMIKVVVFEGREFPLCHNSETNTVYVDGLGESDVIVKVDPPAATADEATSESTQKREKVVVIGDTENVLSHDSASNTIVVGVQQPKKDLDNNVNEPSEILEKMVVSGASESVLYHDPTSNTVVVATPRPSVGIEKESAGTEQREKVVVEGDSESILSHDSINNTIVIARPNLLIEKEEADSVTTKAQVFPEQPPPPLPSSGFKTVVNNGKEFKMLHNTELNTVELVLNSEKTERPTTSAPKEAVELDSAVPRVQIKLDPEMENADLRHKVVVCNGKEYVLSHDGQTNRIVIVTTGATPDAPSPTTDAVKSATESRIKYVVIDGKEYELLHDAKSDTLIVVGYEPSATPEISADRVPKWSPSEKLVVVHGVEHRLKHDAETNTVRLEPRSMEECDVIVSEEKSHAKRTIIRQKVVVVGGSECALIYHEATSCLVLQPLIAGENSSVQLIPETIATGEHTRMPVPKTVVFGAQSFPLLYDPETCQLVVDGLNAVEPADVSKCDETTKSEAQPEQRAIRHKLVELNGQIYQLKHDAEFNTLFLDPCTPTTQHFEKEVHAERHKVVVFEEKEYILAYNAESNTLILSRLQSRISDNKPNAVENGSSELAKSRTACEGQKVVVLNGNESILQHDPLTNTLTLAGTTSADKGDDVKQNNKDATKSCLNESTAATLGCKVVVMQNGAEHKLHHDPNTNTVVVNANIEAESAQQAAALSERPVLDEPISEASLAAAPAAEPTEASPAQPAIFKDRKSPAIKSVVVGGAEFPLVHNADSNTLSVSTTDDVTQGVSANEEAVQQKQCTEILQPVSEASAEADTPPIVSDVTSPPESIAAAVPTSGTTRLNTAPVTPINQQIVAGLLLFDDDDEVGHQGNIQTVAVAQLPARPKTQQQLDKEAFVTLATNDTYCLGALVWARSLRRVNTTRKLVVMISPAVTSHMKSVLEHQFDLVQCVDILDSRDSTNLRLLARPDLGVTFTKLHCWRLTQFTKGVFMDADTMIVRNCDELFDREEFSAAPDAGWPDCFNSGVFVFRPSEETYRSLVSCALTKGSFDGGDQGLLNLYFKDWATQDISRHLPFVYNVVSQAFYSYMPAVTQFRDDVKVVHFVGATKPWHHSYDESNDTVRQLPGTAHDSRFLHDWWRLFRSDVQPLLTQQTVTSKEGVTQLRVAPPNLCEHPHEGDEKRYEMSRQQDWERGHIDYLGADSFDNIQKHLAKTMGEEALPSQSSATTQTSPPSDAPKGAKNGVHKTTNGQSNK